MIIRNFTASVNSKSIISSAIVIWEDHNYPEQVLFFEIDDGDGEGRGVDEPLADAFLAACFPLAAIHGERRLKIEGRPCPMLVEGLRTAYAWWQSWGGMPGAAPVIETLPRGRSQIMTGSRCAF